MAQSLYLLDGMALVYRAHFAFMRTPIMTSSGVNTSALYGFTNALVELVKNRKPTHLALVFDTSAPTQRHVEFPAYKAQRESMPEDLSAMLPHVRRMAEAFNVPVIAMDGYEADDVIGTLARRAENTGDFTTFMVTPDKDFGQLVDEKTFIYKPGPAGDAEILGVKEVCERWEITNVLQVIDILGLWGDAVDNIPGIPGFGEKTAKALIGKYGSIENLIAHADELKGKQQEKVREFGDQALLSKRLATIDLAVPVTLSLDELKCHPMDEEKVRALMVEFEFNSLGKRLFGPDFSAGRSAATRSTQSAKPAAAPAAEDDLLAGLRPPGSDAPDSPAPAPVQGTPHATIKDTPHTYRIAATAEERADLIAQLQAQPRFCFDTETSSLDEKLASLVGLAFSWEAHTGWYVPIPPASAGLAVLQEFAPLLTNPAIEKVGHNLKFDLNVLAWNGIEAAGPFFDTMLAHALLEPDQRHGMDFLSEVYLNYTPVPISALIGSKKDEGGQLSMLDVAAESPETIAEYAAEDADITWQLAAVLRPLLEEKGLHRVFFDIESPLLPVLAAVERAGFLVDVKVLLHLSQDLAKLLRTLETDIQALAGGPFNLNSPKQLGEVLFNRLKLSDKPKKTKTGQYQTNEETLQTLAGSHPIIEKILDYRESAKLKSTYVDSLPHDISPRTGRVHTSFMQVVTATGRLASSDPNLQNIPIRTPMGREVRRAFIAPEGLELLCADYSQVELRVMAALSGDPGMRKAFAEGLDIHAATASSVYGVPLDLLLPEMRRAAKMVNFGIIYGISAFGLAQRLAIPREEARTIIEGYFTQYPGVKRYMDDTIASARKTGFVETLTGRRRFLRDINSANATVRGAAERVAINTPIQGTAADLIKIAMTRIADALKKDGLKTRMVLQVHDELVFEVPPAEKEAAQALVTHHMQNALPLDGVPVVVDCGFGKTWLDAH